MAWYDGLASSAVGAIGSLFSGYSQAAAQRQANQANFELAKYSYDRNLEQWNAQNEYNKPLNQMKRYKEAGLNPNLIYSQGSSGNASSSPQMSTPQIMPVTGRAQGLTNMFQNLANFVGTQLDLQLKREQINGMKSDNTIKALNAVTESQFVDEERSLRTLSNAEKGKRLQMIINQLGAEAEARKSRFQAADSIAHYQKAYYDAMLPVAADMADIAYNQANENFLLTSERKALTSSQRNVLDKKALQLAFEYDYKTDVRNLLIDQLIADIRNKEAAATTRERDADMSWRNIGVNYHGIKLTLGQLADFFGFK